MSIRSLSERILIFSKGTKMDDGSSATRRERRTKFRKDEIIQASARLFAEKGYHHTTTREIAQAANVAEGTIFKYFDSKEGLLIGIMAQLVENEALDVWLENLTQTDDRNTLQELLRYRLNFAEENYTMLKATLSEILVDPELSGRYYHELLLPFMQTAEQTIQSLIAKGKLEPVNAQLVVRVITSAMLGLFVLRALDDPILHPENPELTQLPELISFMILNGLNRKDI